MKLREAIERIDSLKHNTFTQGEKVEWLDRLDGLVKAQIIDTHEGAEEVEFSGYSERENMETELMVPAPYDDIYMHWLEAQIDYYNGELGRYNNSIAMFNAAYEVFQRFYNRTHKPLGKKLRFF